MIILTYTTQSGKVIAIDEDGRRGFSVTVDGMSTQGYGGDGLNLHVRDVAGTSMTCIKSGTSIIPVPAAHVELLTTALSARKAAIEASHSAADAYEHSRARILRSMDA